MKAIQFNAAIPRYLLGISLGKLFPGILWSGLSCTDFADIPEPNLPGPNWIKVRTRYGGICGSDTGTIHLHTSPYYSPFSSSPFTLGHENAGTVLEAGPQAGDFKPGDRIVVEPVLWCAPRGFKDPCPACARGEINRCERTTAGMLSPGIILGACRDTGGSWSPVFLAHTSQVYRVPDAVSDENALMVEPFAVGLHAVAQNFPKAEDVVIVQGAGTIGLTVLAALQALGSTARTIVMARYPFQAEAARRLGASEVLVTRGTDVYAEVSRLTGAALHTPILGKRVVTGGASVVFECVGSDSAIDDGLRFTRSGGRLVLVGVPGVAKGIDWTAIFAQELTVQAANMYHHAEPYQGQTWKAFDLALHLMASGKVDLGWMVTHRYPLSAYKQALQQASQRGTQGMIKSVFDFS